MPLVLVSAVPSCVPAASQCLDLVNLVTAPFGILLFAAPVSGAFAGLCPSGIVGLSLGGEIGGGVAFLLLVLRVLPVLRRTGPLRPRVLDPRLRYGRWIADGTGRTTSRPA